MTTDEQRIFVCERLFGIKPPEPHQIAEGYSFQDWVDDLPPLTLDWLHECEKKLLNDVQRRKYAMAIHVIVKAGEQFSRGLNYFACLHATAEQRLAALVETIQAEKKK